jgi:hypothetical protein
MLALTFWYVPRANFLVYTRDIIYLCGRSHWLSCNNFFPILIGAFSEVVFEFERKASYFGSLRAKLFVAPFVIRK